MSLKMATNFSSLGYQMKNLGAKWLSEKRLISRPEQSFILAQTIYSDGHFPFFLSSSLFFQPCVVGVRENCMVLAPEGNKTIIILENLMGTSQHH